MKNKRKIYNKLILFLVLLLFSLIIFGCVGEYQNNESFSQGAYYNCTTACAIIIDEPGGLAGESDEFTALNYCHEECKRKFID